VELPADVCEYFPVDTFVGNCFLRILGSAVKKSAGSVTHALESRQ